MVKQYKNRQSDLHGDSLKFCIVTFSKMPWMGCWRFCRSVLHNENTAIYVITSENHTATFNPPNIISSHSNCIHLLHENNNTQI